LPELKAVITTAEMLLPHYRQGIEKNLNCEVYDNLGSNDGGYEAYECKFHQGLHYNDLQSILEVDVQENNGNGRLLITNLWNKSTPFIRYENGDIVSFINEPCQCGVPFPRIRAILGRTADILTFNNGISLAGPAITLIFAKMKIDGWQVVQTGPRELEVRLLGGENIFTSYEAEIKKVLMHYLGSEIKINVKQVDNLRYTPGGKWKPIWREFNCLE
jgi:phenylacetate-CoA ligase